MTTNKVTAEKNRDYRMDLKQALQTLGASFKVDEDGTTLVTTTDTIEKELTLDEIDLAVATHRQELEKIAASSLVGGMQYYHKTRIQALELVRKAVLTSGNKAVPSIDPKHAPSLFDNAEYRELVDLIGSHKLYKTIDPKVAFAYTMMCRTCGEVSIDTDEDLHVAHQLLLAGFRKV